MSCNKHLAAIDGGKRLVNGLDSCRMKPVLRLLDQVNAARIRHIGQNGKRHEPQFPLRKQPRWNFNTISEANHQISVPILWPENGPEGFEVGQTSLEVLDPILE